MMTFSNWYTMVLMYSGLREPEGEIKTRGGLKFAVRSKNDLAVLDEVVMERAYDQSP
jgi:hypothetical protein